MKRIILAVILSVFIVSGYAQDYLGFKAGVNVATLTSSQSRAKAGYSVGMFYDKAVTDSWHLFPSVSLAYTQSASSKGSLPTYSSQSYAVEVPLLLSYRVGDENIALMFDFGPFARYGFYGKSWIDAGNGRQEFNTFSKKENLDFGAQAGFGACMSQFYINFAVQYGMVKPWEDRRGNSFNYSLSLGYAFSLN